MTTLRGGTAAALGPLASFIFPFAATAEPLVTSRPLDLHLERLIVALVFCVAIAVGAVLLLKRASKTQGRGQNLLSAPWLKGVGQAVTVLESRRISMHADVCRVACAGREYLVVVSPGGATVLKESAQTEPAA